MTDHAAPLLHRARVRHVRGYWWATCTVCRWERMDRDRNVILTEAREHRTPALQLVLDATPPRAGLDYGPGGFCPDCPFRDPQPSYEERDGGYIDNDPTEAHYDCRLLDSKVWGEYSPCAQEDWQRQARRELAEFLPVVTPA